MYAHEYDVQMVRENGLAVRVECGLFEGNPQAPSLVIEPLGQRQKSCDFLADDETPPDMKLDRITDPGQIAIHGQNLPWRIFVHGEPCPHTILATIRHCMYRDRALIEFTNDGIEDCIVKAYASGAAAVACHGGASQMRDLAWWWPDSRRALQPLHNKALTMGNMVESLQFKDGLFGIADQVSRYPKPYLRDRIWYWPNGTPIQYRREPDPLTIELNGHLARPYTQSQDATWQGVRRSALTATIGGIEAAAYAHAENAKKEGDS